MQPHGFKNWSFGWHWRKSSAVNTEKYTECFSPSKFFKIIELHILSNKEWYWTYTEKIDTEILERVISIIKNDNPCNPFVSTFFFFTKLAHLYGVIYFLNIKMWSANSLQSPSIMHSQNRICAYIYIFLQKYPS